MPKFRTLTGQFVGYVPDTPDSDIHPDRSPLNGTVTFTPVFAGGAIAFPELDPPEFSIPRPIRAKIVNGFVVVEVSEGEDDEAVTVQQPLSLMVTVDDEATQVWSWRAEFEDMFIPGDDYSPSIPSWSFQVPDGTGPVDLTELVPIKGSGGTALAKGPRGAGLQTIEAVDGQLVFTYTDGQEYTVPVPEAVQGPEGPQGPAGEDGAEGPQGEKGDPGEIPELVVGNLTDATPTGQALMTAATAGAARSTLDLAAGATANNGSPTELNTGTSTTPRVWTPYNLANYVASRTRAIMDEAKPDLVEALQAPIVIAHRGGRYVYPEHSMEGYIASTESGFLPEPDIQFLGDGTMVCLHDATVDRTMTGITGNVSTLTRKDWQQARVRPVYEGGKSAAPVFFEDVLDQLGNRTVIVPEIKGGASTAEVQKVIDAVKYRGLEKSVIIQSADLAACQQIVAAGCYALLLLNTTLPASNPVESGIQFIGASQNMSAANLNTVIGWGGKVIVWTLNSKNAVAGLNSGVVGYFSDDPWYTADRLQSEGVARWRLGQGWPSRHNTEQTSTSTGAEASTRQKISGGQLYVDASVSNSLKVFTDVSHINGGMTPESFIAKGTFTFGTKSAASTANAGFVFYRNTNGTDSTFYDGAKSGQYALTMVLRRNGQLQVWEYVNGAAAVSLGTDNLDTPLALDGLSRTFELVVTKVGSAVKISCLQTGRTLTVTTSVGGVFTPAVRVSRTEAWVGDVSVDAYS